MIDEYRRVRRRRVEQAVHVVDTMTDTVIGRLGNVSETGMLMVASAPLMVDALYQVRFALGDPPGAGEPIEVGAHLLWQDEAGPAGHNWSGFRFITMLESQMLQLRQWLDSPGGHFE